MVMVPSGKPRSPVVRRRSWRGAVALGLLAPLLVSLSCGGRSKRVPGDGDAGEGAEGAAPSGGASIGGSSGSGTGGSAGLGGTAGFGKGGTSGSSQTGGVAGEPPDTNPGCPDASAPPGFYECDVFAFPIDCPIGMGCYPTIDHPFGMGCDQQVHGSLCAPAGTETQGEFCPGGTLDCAPGFICIVGSQAGSRCMRMCSTDGAMPCPAGLFCGETDALGVGVCA
jgi:hypothetical protein